MSEPTELGTDRHLGERAELAALGALSPAERDAVEAHAATCAACTRALATAEATVDALDAAFAPAVAVPDELGRRIAASAATAAALRADAAPGSAARRPGPRAAAAAAALLLAAGVTAGAFIGHHGDAAQAARDSAALATIATSHFNHVSFVAGVPGAPAAKALYARDGGWLYVIVDSATCGCTIVARTGSAQRDLGTPQPRGTTATAFVADAHRPETLELRDSAGRVIARAPLVYPAR